MRVLELHRYPVKSLGGQYVRQLAVERWGPRGDRRWAVTDPSGRLQTARTVPKLLSLSATPTPHGITMAGPDGEQIAVPTPTDGDVVPTTITRSPAATDAGDEAAAFLTSAIGRPLRLVWQHDPTSRSVNPRNGGLDGETLSFADAGPVLLTSVRSLEQLQRRIGGQHPIPMERFRPNVIVDGLDPFAENDWSFVQIGDVPFRVQQRCDRCLMTTIDPRTGVRGVEPLQTLRRDYAVDGQPIFGIRLVPADLGVVSTGDDVLAR